MNKTLEGMAREHGDYVVKNLEQGNGLPVSREAMAAALLWLAANVTDEMVDAATRALYGPANERCTPGAPAIIISAALRAAAGSAPTPPEVK